MVQKSSSKVEFDHPHGPFQSTSLTLQQNFLALIESTSSAPRGTLAKGLTTTPRLGCFFFFLIFNPVLNLRQSSLITYGPKNRTSRWQACLMWLSRFCSARAE